jgi:hypothetical protein
MFLYKTSMYVDKIGHSGMTQFHSEREMSYPAWSLKLGNVREYIGMVGFEVFITVMFQVEVI